MAKEDSAAVTGSEASLLEMARKFLYPNYRPAPFVLVRGAGCFVYDEAGRRYLDLAAGVAVCTLGHAHPRYVAALGEQAGRLGHVSNYFYNEPNVRLAALLCQKTGMDRVLFCNSGAEANEALLKLARHHHYVRGQKQRVRVVAFLEAFHGRTLGALSMTGRAKYREGFGLVEGLVTHVPYGDADAVAAAMGDDVAGIVFEPVQGEGGVIPGKPEFVAQLRRIADDYGALLLADEVQTGVGRTGTFLACERSQVQPDAVALAKGLGAGFPIGAMLCREALAEALPPGSHGSTFGGNPLASAAALTVLSVMDEEKLLVRTQENGEALGRALSDVARAYDDLVDAPRGVGLLWALPFRTGVSAATVLARVRELGVLLTLAGDNALRFSPPLVVSVEELEHGVSVVKSALAECRAARAREARKAGE